jgi:hypothetical protein
MTACVALEALPLAGRQEFTASSRQYALPPLGFIVTASEGRKSPEVN